MSLLDTASLLVTPNAYKEGKLYSVIPSDGSGDFTFTRATTATRVNSDGLVELVPYNLFSYSEQFDNAAWQKTNCSIIANNTTAPDGTTTADKLILANGQSGSSSDGAGIRQFVDIASGSYTYSIYAKAAEFTTIRFRERQVTGAFLTIDLTNGAISTNAIGASQYINPTATLVSNGWYRITFQTPTLTALSKYSIRVSETGNGTSGIFIWGYQAVEGSNALPYQKTETRLNIPRLDYSLGGCPNILLEPQRTNLALQSSSFDSATWTKVASSVTANQIASPSGVQDADKLTENSANEIHGLNNLSPYPSITTATASLFFKKGTRKFFSIKLQIGANSYTQVYDSESVTTTSNSSNGLTSVSSTIVDFGNGWVRATLTGTNPSGAGNTYIIYCLSDSGTPTFDPVNFNPTYQGTGTDYGYLWGAQLEAGSYATSYIPTTTASVTRNVDVASKTGASALIGQTEGTMFIEMASLTNSVVSNYFSISDGTYANRASILFSSGTNFIRSFLRVNSISQFDLTASGLNITEMNKIAFAYRQNDFAMYVNGVLIGQSNTGDTFNPNTLSIVSFSEIGSSLGQLNARVNQATLYKERLTNDQLAQLTTI